jgi:hypothetical protein
MGYKAQSKIHYYNSTHKVYFEALANLSNS